MALAFVNGEAFTSGETVTPNKLNTLVTGMSVTMAANKLLGTTTAGAASEVHHLAVGSLYGVVSSQFNKTDTTLANVTGLSVTLEASTTYNFEAVLFILENTTGKSKVAPGGTATASSLVFDATKYNYGDASIEFFRGTVLGTPAAGGGADSPRYEIRGTITTSGAGTLTIMFAQDGATGTSSVLVGSWLRVFKAS